MVKREQTSSAEIVGEREGEREGWQLNPGEGHLHMRTNWGQPVSTGGAKQSGKVWDRSTPFG